MTEQAQKAELLAESRRRATDLAVREKEEAISGQRQEAAELRTTIDALQTQLAVANTKQAAQERAHADAVTELDAELSAARERAQSLQAALTQAQIDHATAVEERERVEATLTSEVRSAR